MRQLTSLDAQFLVAEDGRTHGHVCALSILDPSTTPTGTLTLADITRVFRERLHLLPPLRWRLVEVPLGLDYPYWIDDPDFDLEFHVRELYLPPPGDKHQLAEQVSRIVSRPLDRSRPLWECYLIGGLEGGQSALLVKLHHSLVDGVSGAEILGVLFDLSPDGREVPPAEPMVPDRLPTKLRLFSTALLGLPRQPLRVLRGIPDAMQHFDTLPTLRNIPGGHAVARGVVRAHEAVTTHRDGRLLEAPLGQAPRTAFNKPISPYRSVAFATLSLADIKKVKSAFDATVNDVVVALCTAAIRAWLLAHDSVPDDPLLAMVPMSVRTEEQMGTFGNRVSVMIVPLATDEPDAAARLHRTHETLLSAKERHRAVPADILASANELVPPSMFARAARVTAGFAASSRFAPPYNVIISNVPGPPIPVYIAGARQVAMIPVSVIVEGVGLNFTVFSYEDRVDFGVVADRELMPDLSGIVESLDTALADLLSQVPSEEAAR